MVGYKKDCHAVKVRQRIRRKTMKKMLKRNSGFTLIELIVVIAILAILAGIGTVAYSGYINKAHKANDIQLAGDVKYALELAAVAPGSAMNGGEQVKLKYNAEPEFNSVAAENAVKAAFGENYKDALKLQYDKWKIDKDFAQTFKNSSFYDGSSFDTSADALMGNVQTLTNAVGDFFSNDKNSAAFNGQFGNYLKELEKQGIDVSSDNAKKNAVALNVARMLSAYEQDNKGALENAMKNSLEKDKNVTGGITGSSGDTLNMLPTFAVSYLALKSTVEQLNKDCPKADGMVEINATMEKLFSGSNDYSKMQVTEITKELQDAINTVNTAVEKNDELKKAYKEYQDKYAAANTEAILASMNAINTASSSIKNDLGSDDMYTTVVSPMLKKYLNEGILPGSDGIIIIYDAGTGKCAVSPELG